jgi:hypothetical protein
MSSSSFNRNPTGKKKKQHNLRELSQLTFFHFACTVLLIVGADDETLKAALLKYHQEKLSNNVTISKHLQADYGIQIVFAGPVQICFFAIFGTVEATAKA